MTWQEPQPVVEGCVPILYMPPNVTREQVAEAHETLRALSHIILEGAIRTKADAEALPLPKGYRLDWLRVQREPQMIVE